MRVLVTGAGGFIGRHLVAALLAGGHAVVTLSRRTAPPFPDLPHLAIAVEHEAVVAAVQDVDLVVHLAGLADASASWRAPLTYARVNATGTLHLLEGARQAGAGFILASTQRVYRPRAVPVAEDAPTEPTDPYGYSKLVAERWVELYHRHYGVPTTIVRLFSVYGPGQVAGGGTSGVVAIFLREALAGRPLRVFGHQFRDFVEVSDVARGLWLVAERLAAGNVDHGTVARRATPPVYNLGTGRATSLHELAALVRATLGVDVPIEECAPDRPTESDVADVRRIAADLGFQAQVGLEEGLHRFASWYREQCKDSPEGAADTRSVGRPAPAADGRRP